MFDPRFLSLVFEGKLKLVQKALVHLQKHCPSAQGRGVAVLLLKDGKHLQCGLQPINTYLVKLLSQRRPSAQRNRNTHSTCSVPVLYYRGARQGTEVPWEQVARSWLGEIGQHRKTETGRGLLLYKTNWRSDWKDDTTSLPCWETTYPVQQARTGTVPQNKK